MKPREKLVNKRLPMSLLDLPAVERWLGEQAAQGLLLVRCDSRRFRFRQEVPRPGRRYHLCPTKDSNAEAPQELVDLYAQSGWQYAATVKHSCACIRIFYTDDPAAPEPFNDADSLLQALRYPVRECVGSLVFALVSPLLYAVLLSAVTYIYHILSYAYLFLVLTNLRYVVSSFTDLATVLLLRRSLKRGRPFQSSLSRLLHRLDRGFSAVTLILWALALLLLLPPDLLTLFRSNIPLERFHPDFDLLTLEEMEENWTPQENWSTRERYDLPSYATNFVFRYNEADIRYYPLYSHLRTQYRVDQTGTGDSGSSSMDLYYFVARSPRWAQEHLDDLKADQTEVYYTQLTAPYQAELIPGAEEFCVRREGADWEVLARTGERVLALQYTGNLDLSQWYDDIAAMPAPAQ